MFAGVIISPAVEQITQGWHDQTEQRGDDLLGREE